MPSAAPRLSRSQAERRAATRQALLEATIDTLVEVGWSALSTRAVALRAGVTLGAQQYHFPTKAALVEAAIDSQFNEARRRAADLIALSDDEQARAGQLIDLLWSIHALPISSAILEIMAVSRTDPNSPRIVRQMTEATDLACGILADALPTYAARPGFRDFVLITVATMRGAILASVPGAESAFPSWPELRAHILSNLNGLLEEGRT
ncbi:TetR/AcrR family transcriptional regulator [Nocardia fluminea]|uniref:TetR/AcrR family transcriptional regulator n=1 Tax=Nocardia fluminea TaxID=134984 RepID=UPI00342AEB2E